METLKNIRIVLVEPEHPGNIGAVARAMANMGLSRLVLVAPLDFPSPVAIARASGAASILENATVVQTLDEALAECTMVVASTARARTVRWPAKSPEDAMRSLLRDEGRTSALVFGRESDGLTNAELDRCHVHARIPVAESFSSMNLGSAVSVMLYELRRQALAAAPEEVEPHDEGERVNGADMRHFLEHFRVVLKKVDPARAGLGKRHRVITRVFRRAPMLATEVHMLRGILSAIEAKIDAS